MPEPSLLQDFRAVLDWQEEHEATPFSKQFTLIEEAFGVRPTRYYQVLNRVLDMPDALAYKPQLVYRLRARRQRQTTERTR